MSLFSPTLRAIALAAPLLLAACGQQQAQAPVAPKPVKVERVGSAGDAGSDSFIGTARARQRTDLGFDTPGRVAAVLVDVGSRVKVGQVLARLDDEPARLRLAKAEADLSAASAVRAERRNALRQEESLARDQIISASALQAVQAGEVQATSQLEAAEAAVRAARRELAMARITAPFDGEVVARAAQPHADVAPGQPVLSIESGRELEVLALLPERLAAALAPGQAVAASAAGEALALRLHSVSARADNGSLVQAIFRIEGKPAALRSGSVVSLELRRAALRTGTFSVPAAALMPTDATGQASVYVLDEGTGMLSRRSVRVAESALLPGGRVAITRGLSGGEQIVVAGTSFLSEGQRVVAHSSQTVLQESRP